MNEGGEEERVASLMTPRTPRKEPTRTHVVKAGGQAVLVLLGVGVGCCACLVSPPPPTLDGPNVQNERQQWLLLSAFQFKPPTTPPKTHHTITIHRGQMQRRPRRPFPLLLLLLLLPTVHAFRPPTTPADTTTVEGWLARMSLEEKVAQMNHVPIRSVLHDLETDPTLDKAKLRAYLLRTPIGLIANTPFDGGVHGQKNKSGWSVAEWRALQKGTQEVAHGKYSRLLGLYTQSDQIPTVSQ